MTMILNWLAGRIAGPAAALCALLLGAGLVWQTARIDGWPLIGGGFKDQVSGLAQQIAARDLALAKAQSAALQARAGLAEAADGEARVAAAHDQAIQNQIQTLIREVPVHVSDANDRECIMPWGAVRLLDAAASGAQLGDVAARVAPGQPDDAASDIKLPEAVALLAADFGIARQNGEQLAHLEKAVSP
jgi:hypothetical protein